jgi:hypothetical protein
VPTEAHDLNLASIGVASVAGSQTVYRTVTSVAEDQGWMDYQAVVDAPPGYAVTVSPASLRLRQGETASYAVTLTNVGAPIGEWRFGSLAWLSRSGSGKYAVSSPIAVQGSLFKAPLEIGGGGASGVASFQVSFGYSGAYTAAPHGLMPATVTSDNVLQDPDQGFSPGDGFSNLHQFPLSGVAHFRIAMPPEATEADADLDIYLQNPAGQFVASSTSGGTDELIDVVLPMDGTWRVWVHGWSTPGGDSDYLMWTWTVPLTSGGSLSVDAAPAFATLGATDTVDVSWFGLGEGTSGDWYVGAVSHTGDSGLMGLTLINIDNR